MYTTDDGATLALGSNFPNAALALLSPLSEGRLRLTDGGRFTMGGTERRVVADCDAATARVVIERTLAKAGKAFEWLEVPRTVEVARAGGAS